MKKQKILKKVISCILGTPAEILMFSEVDDLSVWWIPFTAMVILALVLRWNNQREDI